MELKKLNVDLDEVVEAMEQGGETVLDMSWHLDTHTGKVLMIGGDLSFDANDPPDEFPDDASDWEREAWEDARAVAEDASGRFQEIPQRDRGDAWQVMA